MKGEGGFEHDATRDDAAIYEIVVQGRLDERWAGWFDGLVARVERGPGGMRVTILTGPVADQAALRGILNKMWDLHLTVISVARTDIDGS
jgi:hypothetical protein